jgi:peptidoglycan/LPS O-acetylase OafA/YrhL
LGLRKLLATIAGAPARASAAALGLFHVGPATTTEVATIDGLRAVAVSGVVALHCWGIAEGPALYWTLPFVGQKVFVGGWLHQGELGITLFFILSGFLLGQPFFRAHYQKAPRPALKPYFTRRILRLVPAYYVCLFLAVVCMTPALIDPKQVYSVFGLENLAAHATFTQFWFIDTAAAYRVDASMWTLTHEATFYVVLPFVAFLFAGRRSLLALPAALGLSIGWLWLAHHGFDSFVDWVWRGQDDKLYFTHETIRNTYVAPQFPAHAFNFALGLAMANAFVAVQLGRLRRPGRWLALASFVAGCLTVAGWVHFADFHRSGITDTFIFVGTPFEAIGITLVLAGLVFGAPGVRKLFSLAPIRILGIVSYSAFLWHGPILFAVQNLPSIKAATPEHKMGLLLLYVVPLTLIVSIGSYLLVEKPFLLLARRPARPARGAPIPRPAPPVALAPSRDMDGTQLAPGPVLNAGPQPADATSALTAELPDKIASN